MKIRNTVILLAVSALMAVSCNLFNKFDLDVPYTIDENATVSGTKFLALNDHLSTAPDGGPCLSYSSTKPVTASVTLSDSMQSIGEIEIPIDDAPQISNGSEMESGQIVVTVDNPSSFPVDFKGTITVPEISTKAGSSRICTFSCTVPANQTGYTVLVKPAASTAPLFSTKAETVTDQPLGKIMPLGKFKTPLKIDVQCASATKAGIAPAAAANIKVDASYKYPFKINKGTKIKLVRSFVDLGLKLDDYIATGKLYDIKFQVINSMPFTITGSGDSVQGVSAELSTPIAAGTVKNPVTSNVTATITDNSKDGIVNEASICLLLVSSEDNVKVTSDMGLQFYYDCTIIHKL